MLLRELKAFSIRVLHTRAAMARRINLRRRPVQICRNANSASCFYDLYLNVNLAPGFCYSLETSAASEETIRPSGFPGQRCKNRPGTARDAG
jgi:hypothetical protein